MSDSRTRATGRGARVLKRAGISLGVLLGALLAAHIAWTNSGSNEWQVVSDRDGIRISALKTSGYSLLKYKVNARFESQLSDVVFALTDLDTGRDFGASDLRRIEAVSAPPVSYAYDTYQLTLPRPFEKIEVVILNLCYQDPKTKQVYINVYAAPNKIPGDGNITRVVHLSNNWTLTPVAGGGVDVESIAEMDLGLPYVLANLAMPEVIGAQINTMRELLKKGRYRQSKAVSPGGTYQARRGS